MISNHWSCSKFANWVRGTPKPFAATAEEWNTWKKTAKKKKVRYWLAEECLNSLQDIVCWPINRIRDVRHYINNRWVSKTHALTSSLQRGKWYDLDARLLHAVFDELVNFVEIEQAWMLVIGSDDENKKYKTPWYRSLFRIGSWRCPEAGVAHLEWAAGLKHDTDCDDKKDPNFGKPTSQALAAQETLVLYKWWKEKRPKRPDPSDASDWTDYCEKKRKVAEANGDDTFWSSFITNADNKEISSNILDLCHKIKSEQEEEDTAMLIRLIKVRQSLWT